jgi:hypothetical protein
MNTRLRSIEASVYSGLEHPLGRIVRAREILESSKADLLKRNSELVGYEKEYASIIDGLIGMMKSAEHAHWFKMTGDKSWSTRDRWKLDALDLADRLVKDYDDN